MTIVLNIISSFHIVFSLCARVGWCDVGTEQTRRMAAWTRAFNIAHLELSLGDCHVAIVTVATQFRHCRSWISVLVFIFVCWSVMNVVIIPDNNQNNILPYRGRFLRMPKVKIQGLFNDFEGRYTIFTVLLYSIRGIWLSLNIKRECTYFDLFVGLKKHVIQKTKNHIKNPVHSLLFLTRFSRINLLSTESNNIPRLTSVPQTSTFFGQSSDSKYLLKLLKMNSHMIFCHAK